MTEFLVRCFIKNRDELENPDVRQSYGRLAGCVGIGCNIVLFLIKLFAGLATGAISIMADAFNNLSDAASSVVTLIGFHLAGKPADSEHPYGHGRIEYLSGLFIAAAILMTGVQLFKSSIEKILHPAELNFNYISVAILVISILMKFWMSEFNKKLGNRINSEAMKATAADSLSDCISTASVLVGVVIAMATGHNLDGWIGTLVAIFVCYAGINTAKETIQPLLGKAPDEAFVKEIQDVVMSHPMIIGMHDLVVHDYGPGRLMISLHAEVSCKEDIMEAHDCIDNTERELREHFQCDATIHMDPVDVDDQKRMRLQAQVYEIVKQKNPKWSLHDFRTVPGPTHTNIIFDLVISPEDMREKKEIEQWICTAVKQLDEAYFAVVTVEQSYTN